jgi:hypothetical protein
MRYLPSLYSVTIPPHVSGSFLAHHQEVVSVMWQTELVLLLSRLSAVLDGASPNPLQEHFYPPCKGKIRRRTGHDSQDGE